MLQLITAGANFSTVADLLAHLGGVPAERIRLQPQPGTATERDVAALYARDKRLCELVDGVLVEKAMGFYESRLAVILICLLEDFASRHDLGIVMGSDGLMRLAPGLVRIPDVSFVSWNRLPQRQIPREPVPDLVPDLAVEVLSKSNTQSEMNRKLQDYFTVGVRLVWYLDPTARVMRVYTSPLNMAVLADTQTLTGGAVLPGFALPIHDIFARAEPKPPSP